MKKLVEEKKEHACLACDLSCEFVELASKKELARCPIERWALENTSIQRARLHSIEDYEKAFPAHIIIRKIVFAESKMINATWVMRCKFYQGKYDSHKI